MTASWSACRPVTKEPSAGSPVARAAVIHGSRSFRPRRSFMMTAKARRLAATAASSGDAARIASRAWRRLPRRADHHLTAADSRIQQPPLIPAVNPAGHLPARMGLYLRDQPELSDVMARQLRHERYDSGLRLAASGRAREDGASTG